jgi:hypothetical protein
MLYGYTTHDDVNLKIVAPLNSGEILNTSLSRRRPLVYKLLPQNRIGPGVRMDAEGVMEITRS